MRPSRALPALFPALPSNPSRNMQARDAAPVALTTPYAFPSSCQDAFLPTKTITMQPQVPRDPTILLEVHLANATGCHPHGWPASDFENSKVITFSPAVCPTGWTAYDMKPRTIDFETESSPVEHIATCCPSGFHPGRIPSPLAEGVACVQEGPFHLAVTDDVEKTTIWSTASYHDAWFMAWKETDVPQLSPAPPNITSYCPGGAHVATWVPGSESSDYISSLTCLETVEAESESHDAKSNNYDTAFIPPTDDDDDDDDDDEKKERHHKVPKAALIAVPCLLGFCTLACIALMVWRLIKRKQRKNLAKKGGY